MAKDLSLEAIGRELGSHPLLRAHPKAHDLERTIKKILALVPTEIAAELFPDPAHRPLLLAAVLAELDQSEEEEVRSETSANQTIDRERLIARSRILDIIARPYASVVMADLSQRIGDQPEAQWYDSLLGSNPLPGLNSTLRNLLIAQELNRSVLRGTQYRARLVESHYTWEGLKSTIGGGEMPDLPKGTAKKTYVKFLIAIVDENGSVMEYADYGQGEGREKYGVRQTGEGSGNIVGTPLQKTIDPDDVNAVMRGLKAIENSQGDDADREAIRRLNLHMRMKKMIVDFMELPDGAGFPDIIEGMESLSNEQLEAVLGFARLVKEMWKTESPVSREGKLKVGSVKTVYPLGDRTAMVRFDQPSTRTAAAANIALRSLGMTVETQDMKGSSRGKGEALGSETHTLDVHGMDIVLARYAGFEKDAAQIPETSRGDFPAAISLGGNEHHPTQTLAEVLVFMDHYQCEGCSIGELCEKTRATPPTITFMGHTAHKRADKALIRFIRKHLPHWTVRIVVPEAKYVPQEYVGLLQSPEANFSVTVSSDLTSTESVTGELGQSDFVYISNQEGTSGTEGLGAGKRPADYQLSHEVLAALPTLRVLHPLPASGELDDRIFGHPQSDIADQMQNKVAVIAALVAHMLIARDGWTPEER